MNDRKNIAIVGVGLIGGSIGLALRRGGFAGEVIGVGRLQSQVKLDHAKQLGAITSITTDLQQGVAKADFIVVCTPVSSIADIVLEAASAAPPGAFLTDAGSTKTSIVAKVEAALPSSKHFVGSHPLTGSEKTGVEYARPDLFDGRVVVVTPSNRTKPDDIKIVCEFWSSLGAKVMQLPPDVHDAALAGTSHLPHLIASALAGVTPPDHLNLTAGGWRDVTRIAGADPALWTQILLENRVHVLKSLTGFEKTVQAIRTALEREDAAQLRALLTEGKQVRDALGD
jgi:prephenate dehydrogenase